MGWIACCAANIGLCSVAIDFTVIDGQMGVANERLAQLVGGDASPAL